MFFIIDLPYILIFPQHEPEWTGTCMHTDGDNTNAEYIRWKLSRSWCG